MIAYVTTFIILNSLENIQLNDGEQILLPSENLKIDNGSLILIAELYGNDSGEILFRKVLKELNKGEKIPNILVKDNLLLYIRALSELNISSYEFENENERINCQDTLSNELLDIHGIESDIKDFKYDLNKINKLGKYIEFILKNESDSYKKRLISNRRLDCDSSLINSLEINDAFSPVDTSLVSTESSSIIKCLSFLSNNKNITLSTLDKQINSHHFNKLNDLINKFSLIAREVELNNDSFNNDCGDLLLFINNSDKSPVAIKSFSQGYYLFNPLNSEFPVKVLDLNNLNIEFNTTAYSIYPSFKEKDLTTLGLLRFTYGEPSGIQKLILTGLFSGLLVGFILSIGKDVGAARWIFGLGLSGLMIGITLGFLSGGFRVAVLLMFLSTMLGLIVPTFNTLITNYALPERDFNVLLQLSFILLISGLVRVSLEWTQNRFLQIAQQKGSFKAQMASVSRLLSLPVKFFNKYTFGDLQLRFQSIEELRIEIQSLLEGGLIRATLTSIYILFMLRISVKLTFLAFIISLILIIPTVIIGLQTRPLERKQQELEGEAQSKNLELINSVSKLRLSGAEYEASSWWASSFKRIINIEILLDAKESVSQLLQTIIPNLGNLLIYIVITKIGSEALLDSNITSPNVGQLLGFFSAFGTFIGAMVSLSNLVVGAFDLPIIYERARPILTEKPEDDNDLFDPGELQGNIKIVNLRYQYKSDCPFVLDNLNIAINPGEFVALTGPSGCGKSTLVRILLGFDKVNEGNIYIDGKNLNGLRKDLIRKQIGTVNQNSAIFAGSLFDSIAGGRVITLEQAWEALQMVSMAEDVRKMPMGMYTVIPEGGGTLSGGQKQRLAIARALVGKPKILIFDEATSALDNPTQHVITKSLEDLNVTRIVIAHRLSTIKNADKIFVINNGKVEEEGVYETLVKNNGLFTKLVERQIA